MKPLTPYQVDIADTLTLAAGYVDAVGYLSLGRVYVANMSGNSVSLGIGFARLEWAEIWRRGWPILSYVIGLLISRFIVTSAQRRNRSIGVAAAFTLEAALLAGFLAVPRGNAGVFLCACAMGIQAATVSRFGTLSIFTSFVTGTLVKMGESAVEAFWAVWDARSGQADARKKRSRKVRRAVWYARTWAAYLAGAIAGALVLARLGTRAIVFVLPVLAAVIVASWRSPRLVGAGRVR